MTERPIGNGSHPEDEQSTEYTDETVMFPEVPSTTRLDAPLQTAILHTGAVNEPPLPPTGESHERAGWSSIAGITYNGGKNHAAILADTDGVVHVETSVRVDGIDFPFSPDSRTINANAYSIIQIAQIRTDHVQITQGRTRKKGSGPLNMSLYYRDAESGEEDSLQVSEPTLLDVLTGTQGGIMIFDNDGRPEENALVIETETDEGIDAFIGFFKPERQGPLMLYAPEPETREVDSLTGMDQFYGTVIQALQQYEGTARLETRVLTELQREQAEGDIKASQTQLDGFMAQSLAHARLASQDSDSTSWEFIDQYFPRIRNSLRQKLLPRWGNEHQSVDEAMQELIVNHRINIPSEEPPEVIVYQTEEDKDPTRGIKLETDLGRRLHDYVHTEAIEIDYWSGTDPRTRNVLDRHVGMLLDATAIHAQTLDEFQDLERLLLQLSNTTYAQLLGSFRIYDRSPDEDYLNKDNYFSGDYTYRIDTVLTRIIRIVQDRQAEVYSQSQQFPPTS